jgi:hypothetical protein
MWLTSCGGLNVEMLSVSVSQLDHMKLRAKLVDLDINSFMINKCQIAGRPVQAQPREATARTARTHGTGATR